MYVGYPPELIEAERVKPLRLIALLDVAINSFSDDSHRVNIEFFSAAFNPEHMVMVEHKTQGSHDTDFAVFFIQFVKNNDNKRVIIP